MGFDRALTSIAHTPSTMGFMVVPVMADRFESDPDGEGESDLFVSTELDRFERRSWWLNMLPKRAGRSKRCSKAAIIVVDNE